MTTVSYRETKRSVPVGKILCLGRNYAKHAREMGSETPETPVVFLKPPTAIPKAGEKVKRPGFAQEMHHEVELVVLIGRSGKEIRKERAFDHVGGYGIGLDMTLRDVQARAKEKGLPWSVAKGFDTSAPVSSFVRKEVVPDPHNLTLSLQVNGSVRQHSNTRNMIFGVDHLISYLSTVFTLEEGDLIFTGTPEGVGPVHSGDVLEATLEDFARCRVEIA
jgi:2-keto-4-pentenoate hydratase/2-oxohepta-3-ene-1,7-dioic acid hydratase in catechol pathway